MKFVLLTTVDGNAMIVGTFSTMQAAEIAVATLKISHPQYRGWKIVELVGIRELKRGKASATKLRRLG